MCLKEREGNGLRESLLNGKTIRNRLPKQSHNCAKILIYLFVSVNLTYVYMHLGIRFTCNEKLSKCKMQDSLVSRNGFFNKRECITIHF